MESPGFVSSPLIELNGGNTGTLKDGLTLASGSSGSTIRGFVINRFTGDGIEINSSNNNVIEGNWIGLNNTGTTASANALRGLYAINSTGLTIGGTSASSRNVISGNTQQGIYFDNVDTSTIQGNYIGTDASGTGDLNGSTANTSQSGFVLANGSSSNQIGGTSASTRNVISGNNHYGIEIMASTSTNNNVQGNYIGTTITGLTSLGNVNGGFSFWGAGTGNTLGGNVTDAGNVIAGNTGINVLVGNASSGATIQGNYIGVGSDGSTILSSTATGIYIAGASINTLIGTDANGTNDTNERNIISGNLDGVVISDVGTTGTIVAGNYIGTRSTGLAAAANANNGVLIQAGATSTTIGGSTTTRRNVISGNTGDGIHIDGEATDGNVVQNNYIGVNATASASLGNGGYGIYITNGADTTVIGGVSMGNIIGGNTLGGISIDGATSGTTIYGNFIGTDSAGTQNFGNAQHGIIIQNAATNNTVGGTTAGQGNTIANNGLGVGSYAGIYIATGAGTGNTLVANLLYNNSGLGIDLGTLGVTNNDTLDPDTGANDLQNFPVITAATTNGTTVVISGSLNSLASVTGMVVHFYATPSTGNVSRRDAKRYLGSTTVNTDASGNATFTNVSLASAVVSGELVTATATTPGANGNTSELSQSFIVNSAPVLDNTKSPTLTTINEDAGAPSGAVGTLVSALVDFASPTGQVDNVTDPDTSALLGIAITAADTTNGSWYYSTNGGTTWSAMGTVADNSARLLAADANTRIYFQPNANDNGTLSSAITFRAWDQSSGTAGALADASSNGASTPFSTATDTASLVVTAVNDAPTITNSYTHSLATTDENTTSTGTLASAILSGSTWADVDTGAVSGLAITAKTGNGTWQYSTDGTTWNSFGTVTSTNALLITSTTQVRYIPDSNNGETATFSYKAWDQTSGTASTNGTANYATTASSGGTTAYSSNTDTAQIVVSSVNDAPTIASSYTHTLTTTDENTSSSGTLTSAILSGSTWADVDTGTVSGLAITAQTGNGTWQYSTDGTTWNTFGAVSSTNALLITSTTQVRYFSDSNNGETATFSYKAWDQTSGTASTNGTANYATTASSGGTTSFSSNTDTAQIVVTSVNDAPTIASSYTHTLATTDENTTSSGTLASVILSGSTWSDVDTGAVSGLAITAKTGNGIWQYSTDGTTWNTFGAVSSTNALLINSTTQVRYVPDSNNGEIATFSYKAWDQTSGTASTNGTATYATTASSGGTTAFSSNTDTAQIVVTSVNDAPTLGFTGTIGMTSTNEDTISSATLVSDILISGVRGDVDSSALSGIAVTSMSASGTFQYSTDGVTWTNFGSVSSTSSLLLTSSSRVRFVPNGNNGESATFTYRAWDQTSGTASINGTPGYADSTAHGGTTAYSSLAGSVQCFVTSVNDAPTVASSYTHTLATTDENTTSSGTLASAILSGSTWADVDTGAVSGLAITAKTGNGVWQYSTDGATWNSFGAVTSTNALLITSTTQVRYIPDSNNGETATFSYKAWDQTSGTASTNGTANYATTASSGGTAAFSSNTDTAQIVVTSVNDAPTVASSYTHTLATTDENTTSSGTLASAILTGSTWADVDSGAVSGLAITAKTGNGTWQYSTDGTTWNSFGAVTSTNALLITSTTQVRYIPDGNKGETGTFSYKAWDQTSGTASTNGTANYATTASSGGTTAFSSNTDTAQIVVTSVNDAPTIASGYTHTLATTDENTTSSGTLASAILSGSTWADVDTSALSGLAITAKTGNGTWQYSTDGTTWNSFGAVSSTNALLITSTTQVRYIPDNNNGETGTFSYKAWDQTSGTASTNGTANYATTASSGGTNAFSSNTDTAQIVVTNVNDAPTITNGSTVSLSGTNEDSISSTTLVSSLLTSSSWADVDTGAVKGIAITGKVGNGTWQYSTNGTTWTSFGSVSTTSALILDSASQIRYSPDTLNGETATFTFEAWDQTSATASTTGTPQYANASVNGGTTAYSTQSATAQIVVTSINDAAVAVADTDSANEAGGYANGTAGSNPTGNVLTNDYDVDTGDTMAVSGVAAGVLSSASGNVATGVTGTYGSISIAANGAYTYTIDNNNAIVQALRTSGQTLSDTFTYTIQDSGGAYSSTQIVVTIHGANDAPTAVADTSTAVEAGGIANGTSGSNPTGNVLTNDADVDSGDTKTVTGVVAGTAGSASGSVGSVVTGSYGTITIGSSGAYTYTVDNSNASVQGLRTTANTLSDTFTYTMVDTAGLSSTTQIAVTIQGQNDTPTAVNDSVTGIEAGGFANGTAGSNPTGNLLTNDTDVDSGDTKTVIGVVSGAAASASGSVGSTVNGTYGSIAVAANGTYTYTVDNSNAAVQALRTSAQTLSEVFTYTMQDTAGAVSTATVSLTIQGTNDAPVAVANAATAVEASGLHNNISGSDPTGNVLTNDTDVDAGDSKTVIGVVAGTAGSASGSVGSAVVGSFGSLVINANGTYTYTLNNSNATVESLNAASPTISDTFTYTISDTAGLTSTTSIVITIQGADDYPEAVADMDTAVEAGGLNNASAGTNPSGNVLTNDISPNGQTVVGVAAGLVGSTSGSVGTTVTGSYGSVTIDGAGNYTYTVNNNNSSVQALRLSSDHLTDLFSYTIRDSLGYESTTQLTITLNGSNDTPVSSNDTSIAVEAGGASNGTAGSSATGNVLANDTDVDSGDTKNVVGVVAGAAASASTSVGASVTGSYGSIVINTNGSFTYVVDNSSVAVQALRTSGQTLTDVFTYTMEDAGGLSSSATVTVTIQGANDTPIAALDTITAVEAGGVANGTAGTNPSGNVLTNDTDVDSGDTKTVSGVVAGTAGSASGSVGSSVTGSYGAITINSNGSYTYIVDNSNATVQALRTSGQSLTDVFTYSMQDTAGAIATTQVTVTIQGANDTPTTVADSNSATEAGGTANGTAGSNPTGNVLTNDGDVDAGDTLNVSGVAAGLVGSTSGSVGASVAGAYGSINIASNGAYSYTVDNSNLTVQALIGFSNTITDTFTYTVQDAAGATSTFQIVMTIHGQNDAPVGFSDTADAYEAGGTANGTAGTNPSGNVITNDVEYDSGDTTTVTGVAAGIQATTSGSVASAVTGTYGSVTLAANGAYTYTVDNSNAAVQALRLSSQTLTDIFSYTIRDAAGLTSTTQLTVTLHGANDAPNGVVDNATALEAGGTANGTAGTNPSGNVLSNDIDVDSGDTKTVSGVVAGVAGSASGNVGSGVTGSYGSITIASNGSYTYTVDNSNATVQALRTTSDSITDVFSYTVVDTLGLSSTTQITVTIQGANDVPGAVTDAATAVEASGYSNGTAGTNPTGNVLTNDTDIDSADTKTVSGVLAGVQVSAAGNVGSGVTGSYGAITIAADGTYTYTVDNSNATVQALRTTANTIQDVFTYTMVDAGGLASTTQITVTIQGANDAPISLLDTATAVEAGGLANGTAGTNPTGNVLTNDTDIDSGDTKTVSGVAAGVQASASGAVASAVTGTYGSINIAANGSYAYTVDNSNVTVQALRNSSNTITDVFTYTMIDTGGLSSTTQITVTIEGSNDTPTTVVDTATAVEAGGVSNGTAGTDPTGNVLTNDTDVDSGDSKTVSGVAAGVVGSASGSVASSVTGSYGSISIAANGSYTYTVNNANAAVQALRTTANTLLDVFSYTMVDTGGLSSTTQITVTIQGSNDSPVSIIDTATAIEAGGLANGTAGTNPTGNVLANDTDVDSGDTKTVSGVTAGVAGSASGSVGSSVTGSFGSITIAANGTYTYTVDNSNATVQALRSTANTITDVFTYTMLDTAGLASTTQITVTIQGANDTPTSIIDTATAVEAGGVANGTAGTNPTGNVLTNDTDLDTGDTKTVSGVAAGVVGSASTNVGSAVTGSYGSINIASNGACTYTVDNSNATVQALRTTANTIQDVFTYTMVDTGGLASTTQITVTIQGSNDAPISVVDTVTATEAGGYSNGTVGTNPSGNVLTNDTDVDSGDTKTVSGVAAGVVGSASGLVATSVTGTYGSVTIAANGAYTYTVDNSNATVQALRTTANTILDLFTYTMVDTAGLASTTQLTVTIQGANDAPTAVDESMTAVEAGGVANGTAGTNPTGNVLTNDTDIDTGDSKTVSGVAAGSLGSASGSVATGVAGSYGSIIIAANGSYTYTVNNANAAVQALRTSSDTLQEVFTYTMQDTGGLTSTAHVTVTIQGANDAPVPVTETAIAAEAGGVANGTAGTNPSGNVLTNDTDVDAGDTKTVSGVQAGVQASATGNVGAAVTGSFGTITIAADGSYTYTVDNSNATVQALRTSGQSINDVFTYTITDTAGLTGTTQITVTIQGTNDAPTSVSDTTTAVEAGGISNGTAGANPTGNVLTNDTDVDSAGNGETKTVAGVAAGIHASASGSVASAVTGTYGAINIAANGAYTYTVDNTNSAVQALRTSAQTLTDVFTYTMTDTGGLTSTTQITVTIQGSNDAPVAVNDAGDATEAGGLSNGTAGSNATGNVLTNDTDVDSVGNGETKTVLGVAAGSVGTTSNNAGSSVTGSYGSVNVNADGTYTYVIDETNAAVQALRLTGQTLSDIFTYKVTDAAGLESLAELTITVHGANDTPTAVVDNTGIAVEAGGVSNGTAGSNATGNVLTNDTDVDSVGNGETKTVAGVAAGIQASASGSVASAVTGNYGAINIAANGAYTYTVDNTNSAVQALRTSAQTLTDVFTYTMTDTAGLTSTTQITVTIQGTNDAPVSLLDTITAIEAGGVSNGASGTNPTGNVLTNDTDVDSVGNGETKTVSGVTAGVQASAAGNVGSSVTGSYGSISIASNGSYTHTVDNSNSTVQALRNSSQTLTDVFTYTMTDAGGLTSTTQVTVTIQGSNDAPVAVNDAGDATEAGGLANGTAGSNATGNVLTNDTDVDSVGNGETKTVLGVAAGSVGTTSNNAGSSVTGSYGSVTVNADGTYTYVIDETNAAVQALRLSGQTLSDLFTYKVTDAAGLESLAELTITVHGANDTPTAVVDNTGIAVESGGVSNGAAGSNATGNVLTNDTDVDSVGNGETKTVSGVTAGVQASAAGNVGSPVTGSFGSISIASNGSYTYTVDNSNSTVQALRNSSQTLTDVFTYTMTDAGGLTSTTQVTVTIQGSNDAPVAVNDAGDATEAGGLSNGTAGINASGNVLTNDTDVDSVGNGETRTVLGVAAGSVGTTSHNAGSSVTGSYGSVNVNADGTYTYVIDETNAAVQALRLTGQTLSDIFTYKVTDAAGLESLAELTITVHGANDTPTAVVDNTGIAVEAGGASNGTAGSNATGNVLTNDTDVDSVGNGETKAVSGVTAGVQASAAGNVGSSVTGSYGSISIASNGSYTYTVNNSNAAVQALRTASDTLTDVFTYTMTDAGGLTSTTQVTVTIQGSNDAPVAVNDAGDATEAGGLSNGTAGSNATGNVLTNDTDVDSVGNGETKTVLGVAAGSVGTTSNNAGSSVTGSYGSVTVNADGTYTYVIDETNAAVQALRLSGQTLSDLFTYKVTDAAGLESLAELTITVHGANDTPTAVVDNTGIAVESGGVSNGATGSNATGNVLTNDTDVDSVGNGETKAVSGVTAGVQASAAGNVGSSVTGSYGSISIASNGSYTYTVNNSNAAVQALRTASDTLTDVFTYSMIDAGGLNSTTQVTITIQGANDTPYDISATTPSLTA